MRDFNGDVRELVVKVVPVNITRVSVSANSTPSALTSLFVLPDRASLEVARKQVNNLLETEMNKWREQRKVPARGSALNPASVEEEDEEGRALTSVTANIQVVINPGGKISASDVLQLLRAHDIIEASNALRDLCTWLYQHRSIVSHAPGLDVDLTTEQLRDVILSLRTADVLGAKLRDLQSLRDGHWLTDWVISAYLTEIGMIRLPPRPP